MSLSVKKRKKAVFVYLTAIGLLLLAVTSIPYFIAFKYSPEGKVFGGTIQSHDNITSYYSFITQYQNGEILADNRLTPEVNKGVYFNFQFYLIGKLAGLFKTGFNGTFHIWRVVTCLLLISSFYLFTGLTSDNTNLRLITLLLYCLAGGMGWVFVITEYVGLYKWPSFPYPLDTHTGIFPFVQLMIWPHFVFGVSFIIFGLYFFVKGIRGGNIWFFILAGASNIILWLSRPFDALILTLSIFIYIVLEYYYSRDLLLRYLSASIPIIIAIPASVYNYFALYDSMAFKDWMKQAVVIPPLPFNLLVSLGVLVLLFPYCLNLSRRFRSKDPVIKITLISTLVTLALLYSYPLLVFSNQFGMFLTTAIVLFCYSVITSYPVISGKWSIKLKPAVAIALILLSLPSSLYVVEKHVKKAMAGEYSLDREVVNAYIWITENTSNNDTILGGLMDSQYLFRYSKNRVFIGHHSQTMDVSRKQGELQAFFGPDTSENFRKDMLARYNIKYILYGPEEAAIGPYDPNSASFLYPVFKNNKISIFKVVS